MYARAVFLPCCKSVFAMLVMNISEKFDCVVMVLAFSECVYFVYVIMLVG